MLFTQDVRFSAACVFILLLTTFCPAQPAVPIPEAMIPLAGKAPVIDGKLTDECWAAALTISDFIVTWAAPGTALGEKSKNATRAYLLYDPEYLYVGVEAFEADMAALTTGRMTARDKGWADDSIEIFIDPGLTRKSFYQFIINAAGVVLDQSVAGPDEQDITWDSSLDHALSRHEDRWILEARIPLAELGLAPATGSRWGFNIARFEPRSWLVQSWGPVFGNNLQPEKFGILDGLALAYSHYNVKTDFRSWGALNFGEDYIEFEVLNRAEKAVNIIAELTCHTAAGEYRKTDKKITLGPGERKTAALDYHIVNTGVEGRLVFTLRAEDSIKSLYMRSRYFTAPARLLTATLARRHYYLSESRGKVQTLLNVGRKALPQSKLVLTIADSGGSQVSVREVIGIEKNDAAAMLDLSNLPAGRYLLTTDLRLNGETVDTAETIFDKIKGPFDD